MKLILFSLLFFLFEKHLTICQETDDEAILDSNFLQFGGKLFKSLEQGTENNLFLSSLAWYESAALIYNGARGKSAEEIATGFGFQDVESTNTAFSESMPILRDSKDGANSYVNVVRKLYISNKYQVNDDYKKLAKDVYMADIYSMDFQNTDSAESMINQCFAEDTHDIIGDVFGTQTLSQDNTLVSIHAVYKQGPWDIPFDPSLTSVGQFSVKPDQPVPVKFMTMQPAELNYYEDVELGIKYVELPFHNGDASIIFMLPNKVDGLQDIIPHLEKTANPPLKKAIVKVTLPRFQIYNRWDLASLAHIFNVSTVLSKGDADLSGIAGNPGDLTDDFILQLAYIRINEAGVLTPKSENTDIGDDQDSCEGSDVKEFKADHPFLFHVVRFGVITSAGRVVDPSKPIAETEVSTASGNGN